MRAKAKTCSLAISTLSFGVAVLSFLSNQEAQAFPPDAIGTGNSCRQCHGTVGGNGARNPVPGLMDIIGVRTVNLGTQLNGSVRGPLATFDAVPGYTVTLSMDVLDPLTPNLNENPRYALQLKQLELKGMQISNTNILSWTNANPAGSGWVKHDGTNANGSLRPYFTKDLNTAETGTFTFDLHVGTNTPVDLYNLEFGIAGVDGPPGNRKMFYDDEHFYLAVVSPTLFTDTAVTWSAALSAAGYILESTTDAANGPWQTYTGPTSVLEGGNVILMKTTQGPRKYFRLRKP